MTWQRKQIEKLMKECSELSNQHQTAATHLSELLDAEYGENAYDTFETCIDGEQLVDCVNYGGPVPSLEALDRMWQEAQEQEQDEWPNQ